MWARDAFDGIWFLKCLRCPWHVHWVCSGLRSSGRTRRKSSCLWNCGKKGGKKKARMIEKKNFFLYLLESTDYCSFISCHSFGRDFSLFNLEVSDVSHMLFWDKHQNSQSYQLHTICQGYLKFVRMKSGKSKCTLDFCRLLLMSSRSKVAHCLMFVSSAW